MVIREASINDVKQIAKIHVDSWKTTYRGIVPEEYLDSLSYESREQNWQRRLFTDKTSKEFMYVAETKEGRIVGFASASTDESDEPYCGILYTLYILESYQGIGTGSKLIKSIVKRLNDNGISSLKLWAFEDNPFRKFYEKCGGKILDKKVSDVGGKQLNELLYGWENINDILD